MLARVGEAKRWEENAEAKKLLNYLRAVHNEEFRSREFSLSESIWNNFCSELKILVV